MSSLRSPVSAAEVAAVRQPVDEASLLPPRVFHDPEVLVFEQEAWFARSWLCVGREEDAAEAGQYFLATIAGEGVIVIRGRDGELRAFHNVCRHRGSLLVTEPAGRQVRFQCPYHAWTYELDGRLLRAKHTETLIDFSAEEQSLLPVALQTWQGFVFLALQPEGVSLVDHLADLPGHVARFAMGHLRRARRIEYEVGANWKVIAENYSECYHCPGVHPQLNKITPYNLGNWIPTDGPWSASWMPVVGEHDTLTLDGQLHGRALLAGTTEDDLKKIYYFVVWPNLLISLHPDYLMTHRIVPVALTWARTTQSKSRPVSS